MVTAAVWFVFILGGPSGLVGRDLEDVRPRLTRELGRGLESLQAGRYEKCFVRGEACQGLLQSVA
jgi:hypothetical protein